MPQPGDILVGVNMVADLSAEGERPLTVVQPPLPAEILGINSKYCSVVSSAEN